MKILHFHPERDVKVGAGVQDIKVAIMKIENKIFGVSHVF